MKPSTRWIPRQEAGAQVQARPYRWGVTLVLLVAALLRLAALPELPLGLHYDEAANLILTRQIAAGDYRPLFIRAYTGKEVLFFYAAAPWVWMTGGSAWALRLGAAMLGVLTVAATFAAVRAMLGHAQRSASIALLAAGWMALAFPHVLLSRYGFRAISQPLLQALTVAALWRGLRAGRRSWLIAAGLFLGLTGYTYLAARLFPIPLLLAAGWLLLRKAPRQRLQQIGRLAIVLGVAALVFAPMAAYFIANPQAFTTRIAQVAAPTWAEALGGIAACLQALIWPGRGDPYVRFNAPGLSVLDGVSAVLALLGLVAGFRRRARTSLDSAGRLLVVLTIGIMLLPSALATGEITPSNLRMVGLFPFLAVLPAWGLHALLERVRPPRAQRAVFAVLLLAGAVRTGLAYAAWAQSEVLFRAADGEMVLAAQALDAVAAETSPPTVYIASEHYRHPTVAALAAHYSEAKWLTGGATLVLPVAGDAAYLIPESLQPPAPWPPDVTQAWTGVAEPAPPETAGLSVWRLSAMQIEELRTNRMPGASADFAHVVQVYGAELAAECRVGAPCPVMVVWDVLAFYPQLQPVVRLLHPQTGEWGRAMAFHYPPEQWDVGDLVLDQLVMTLSAGTPPGDVYQLGVGFFDPASAQALPRLQEERFAGLEARFPQQGGFELLPALEPPEPDQIVAACPDIPDDAPQGMPGVTALGWVGIPDQPVLPGSEVVLRVCWHALGAADGPGSVSVSLHQSDGEPMTTLYAGEPVPGYGPPVWREGEVLEARYHLRVPRTLPPATYRLVLNAGAEATFDLGALEVRAVTRRFDVPSTEYPVGQAFVDDGRPSIRLLGYDLGESVVAADGAALNPAAPLIVTLYWQALEEMADDYVVFLHLREVSSGRNVAQIDRMPQEGSYPTSVWAAGEVIADRYVLDLPAGLPPGDYELDVGLYLPMSGEHLRVKGDFRLQLAELTLHP